MLQRVLDYSHELLERSVLPGETVVDGTAGNGHDTFFLSKLVGQNGRVLSFDIQEQAIENTNDLLVQNHVENVTLIQDSHAELPWYMPEGVEEIGGAIFNLGYLPGSDKSIVTESQSTVEAVKHLMTRMKKNGLIVLVVYHGHEGGEQERDEVLKYVSRLDQKQYRVLRYGFINQVNNPPFILAIENK